MPYQKKTAHVAEESEQQLAGLKAIDPNLDLGEGCNIRGIQALINQLRQKVNDYNEGLAAIDSTKLEIENLEKQLKQLQQKARLGVAFRYGKESEAYRLAGGTAPSEAARKAVVTRLKAKEEQPHNQN